MSSGDSPAQGKSFGRRLSFWGGFAVTTLGYLSLMIPADREMGEVLLRVVVGFACLFAGFFMSVWPVLVSWLFHDEE